MAAGRSRSPAGRTPLEAALRHLGALRYGNPVELIEHAITWPDGQAGAVLAPLVESTSILSSWTGTERAHAVWRLIEEGISHPQVAVLPRRQQALHAAFRLPDRDVKEEWGASLTDRFKQLQASPTFGRAASTQPMEISWKQGVEQLAEHLGQRFDELRTLDDWARYRRPETDDTLDEDKTSVFRRASDGAQKLVVNLYNLTVLLNGRTEYRRIAERVITSRDEKGLTYYRAYAFSSGEQLKKRLFTPTRALWGCRAEQVEEDGLPVTKLWFPRPLMIGEQAHFITEAEHEGRKNDVRRGWANVAVDHHGIEAGELRDHLLPTRGLTIRVKFDLDDPPTAVWWYAEQSESERYMIPPVDSPYRLDVIGGEAAKTFDQPCQPRESYGIAYAWP